MLRDLYISGVYAAFLVLGFTAPFVFSLGYVWVDIFTPQYIATLLASVPVSLIIAPLAIGGYLLADRRYAPTLNPILVLTVALAIWVTLSTAFWSVAPAVAWQKWNYAFKTIAFSAFIPFVFRSRMQIEAFLQVYVASSVVYFLPEGIKTMLSGGGYGMMLSIVSANSGLAEGSTLAGVSLMLVPIILFLGQNSVLLGRSAYVRLFYYGLAVAAVAAAMGTYERTAVVGAAVLGAGMWLGTRRKILFGVLGAAAVTMFVLFAAQSWNQRISTINNFNQESSALGRILVWRWTLHFSLDHPFGGGFNSFVVNEITFPATLDSPAVVVHGKAFHSIYFEVLGEQGWVGLALFLGLVLSAFLALLAVRRAAKSRPDLEWAWRLAAALAIGLSVLLCCGAFIGIAFQPMFYYLFGAAAALRQYVRRVQEPERSPALGHPTRLLLPSPAGVRRLAR